MGLLNSDKVFAGKEDPNFKCEWNANLKRIMLWRIDDSITPSGDNEFCSYQLQLKSEPNITSSAYVMEPLLTLHPS